MRMQIAHTSLLRSTIEQRHLPGIQFPPGEELLGSVDRLAGVGIAIPAP